MGPRARIGAAAAACAAGLALTGAPAHAQDQAPVHCTLYAHSDAAPGGFGSQSQPYNSVKALIDATTSGHTGCLMAGSRFTENVDFSGRSASQSSPLRITSADPSNPGTIEGVAGGPNPATVLFGADTRRVELVGIRIIGQAGQASPAVVVNGTANSLIGNEITHAGGGTCVLVGESASKRAADIVVDGNAIHSCGGAPGDTAAAGIRAGYTSDLEITGNYVYGNPRHGIVLYPDADSSDITNNLVDGQGNGKQEGDGIHLGGDATSASDYNQVFRNVVSNNEAYQVAHGWAGPIGTGNSLRDNCLFSSSGQQDFRQPPTGYEIGPGNIQNADPQFLDRAAPPAGYGVAPSSPCRDRGPVPGLSVETLPPETKADPEAREVISVTFRAAVDSRFQPGSFALALGRGRSLATFPGGNLQPVGGPVRVGITVPGLKPSTVYAFRLTAENGSGTGRSINTTYRTDAAPRIAVPLFNVSYDHAAKRGGRALSRIRVRPRPNNATRQDVNCVGPGCPFGNRPISYVRRLEGRALKPGAEVTFVTRAQSPIGGLGGRAVSVRVVRRKGGPQLLRKEGCVRPSFSRDPVSGADIEPCLSISRRLTLYPAKPRFRFLRVTRLPIGATVAVRCKGRGCPKLPRCRIAKGGAEPVVSLLGRQRTARVGNVFTVTVLKRHTRPLMVRLALKRKNRVQSRVVQTSKFLPARTRIPRRCASV